MTDPNTSAAEPPPRLVEGVDYDIERGRWVFTAAYHLRRGTCCASGCRHCPYDPPGGGKAPPKAVED